MDYSNIKKKASLIISTASIILNQVTGMLDKNLLNCNNF